MIISSCFGTGSHRVLDLTEGIFFGGTNLLPLFISRLSRVGDAEVRFLAPYFNDELISSTFGVFSGLPHERFSLSVVTRDIESASRVRNRLSAMPWRHLHVAWHRQLHGKLYLIRTASRTFTALIGSHNMTRRGMQSNLELGVLLTGRDGVLSEVFQRCELEALRLQREARAVVEPTQRTAF